MLFKITFFQSEINEMNCFEDTFINCFIHSRTNLFLMYNGLAGYSGFLVVNLEKFSKAKFNPDEDSEQDQSKIIQIECKLMPEKNFYKIEYRSDLVQNLKMLNFTQITLTETPYVKKTFHEKPKEKEKN